MSGYKANGVTETLKNENAHVCALQPKRCIETSRLFGRELCKIFTLHTAVLRPQLQTIHCDRLRAKMNRLTEIYDKLCKEVGECKVRDAWLKSEFSAAELAQLLAPTLSDGRNQRNSAKSDTGRSKSERNIAAIDHNAGALQTAVAAPDKVAVSTRRAVLVPLSGGIASLACAWWALQRRDFDVYFCYLVGVDRACVERELLCIGELMRYVRDSDGRPLAGTHNRNFGALTCSPRARLKILPMPTQPYALHGEKRADEWRGAQKQRAQANEIALAIKHHPLTYALMYRQILNAAQAFGCQEIVWGAFDSARNLIGALEPLFSKKVHAHRNWFPFEQRRDALRALMHAASVSSHVWRNVSDPIAQDGASKELEKTASTSATEQKPCARNNDAHAENNSTSAHASDSSDTECDDSTAARIVLSCCASLMPDVAQYAHTCGNSKKISAPTPASETETAQDYLKRRRKGVKLFNWCGNCCDCAPWADVVRAMAQDTATPESNDNSLEKHTLLDAYTLLLQKFAQPSYTKTSTRRKRSADRALQRPKKHVRFAKDIDNVDVSAILFGNAAAKRENLHDNAKKRVRKHSNAPNDNQSDAEEDEDDDNNDDEEDEEGASEEVEEFDLDALAEDEIEGEDQVDDDEEDEDDDESGEALGDDDDDEDGEEDALDDYDDQDQELDFGDDSQDNFADYCD